MNALEEVEHEIQTALPHTWTRLRRPRSPEGEWWLDAKLDEHTVTVQWSPRRGFGVSASFLDEGFGEGPEEVFNNSSEVSQRVVTLLASRGHTQPPAGVKHTAHTQPPAGVKHTVRLRHGKWRWYRLRENRRKRLSLFRWRRIVDADYRISLLVDRATGFISSVEYGKRLRVQCEVGRMAVLLGVPKPKSQLPFRWVVDVKRGAKWGGYASGTEKTFKAAKRMAEAVARLFAQEKTS